MIPPTLYVLSGAGWHPNVTYFAGKVGFCVNCGADPLGGALWATGRPRPALASKNQAPAIIEEPARGPAADEGVRPTK
jgi:hypothetical protein